MKTCAICGHESDADTCPMCGEASWLPGSAKKPEPAPEPVKHEANAAPESEKPAKKRGRK